MKQLNLTALSASSIANFQARLQQCEKGLSVSCYLSVGMEQLGSNWKDFHKLDILEFFENLSRRDKFD